MSEIEWVEFTPEMAEEALRRVGRQRNQLAAVVKRYASDMRDGRWTKDASLIVFDQDGYLINGQHRLSAVVASGCTIGFWVARGWQGDAIFRMDQGRVRMTRDQLGISGIRQGSGKAPAAAAVLKFEFYPGIVWNSRTTAMVTPSLVHDEVVTADFAYSEGVRAATRLLKRANVTHSVGAALNVIVGRYGSFDEWGDFEEGIATGSMLRADDPRLAIRNFWISPNRKLAAWGGQQSGLMAMIIAWNKYIHGEPLKVLKTPRRVHLPMTKPH